ncbi:MAG TPA: hypothetical protein VLT87_27580 [Thermoanaerobaculia bacterium]|nr:hypothetical protein [Thermoanaerobaculia bacterium]
MANGTSPCIKLPRPEVISIPLPFGAEIKSIIDASKPPNDCSVATSLMLQLSPLLASMTCLIKMLKVLAAVKKVVDGISVPPNPVQVLSDVVTEVAPALADVAKCFLLFDPCQLARMISAILGLILSYLRCMVQAVESILNFQIGIDLNAAQGNPVLLASLGCAQDNAETSMMNLAQALEAIQPVLDLTSPLLELAGLPAIEMPPTEFSTGSLADLLAAGEDPLKPVKDVMAVLETAKQAADAIC